jgi:hypothetical protein
MSASHVVCASDGYEEDESEAMGRSSRSVEGRPTKVDFEATLGQARLLPPEAMTAERAAKPTCPQSSGRPSSTTS